MKQQKQNKTQTFAIISFVKVEYVAELLYCIASDCIDAPAKSQGVYVAQ